MKPINYIENKNINRKKLLNNDFSLVKNYGIHNYEQMLLRSLGYYYLFDFFSINHNKVLDLGCGFGFFTQFFGNISSEVEGYDFFLEAINFAKAKNKFLNIKYKLFDIYNKEIKKNSFDIVFCREFHPITRNYYENKEHKDFYHSLIIKKISRSLKKNGHLIVVNKINKNNIEIEKLTKNRFTIIIRQIDETGLILAGLLFSIFKSKVLFFKVSRIIFYFRKIFSTIGISKRPIEIIILKIL